MAQRRYSKQRELIFEAVCGTNEHPTAETVYHWLKPDNPALSLGTVYRNLNLLADEGRLLRLPLPVERFDANTAPHAHFRCRLCGRVYDLDGLDYNAGLDEKAETRSGHRVERHELIFTGVCANCTDKQ